ncbi:hypothetical protein YC2023_019404 [Brassica napus]
MAGNISFSGTTSESLERPICVCYEAIGGCIVGQILSLSLMVLLRKHKNLKISDFPPSESSV